MDDALSCSCVFLEINIFIKSHQKVFPSDSNFFLSMHYTTVYKIFDYPPLASQKISYCSPILGFYFDLLSIFLFVYTFSDLKTSGSHLDIVEKSEKYFQESSSDRGTKILKESRTILSEPLWSLKFFINF